MGECEVLVSHECHESISTAERDVRGKSELIPIHARARMRGTRNTLQEEQESEVHSVRQTTGGKDMQCNSLAHSTLQAFELGRAILWLEGDISLRDLPHCPRHAGGCRRSESTSARSRVRKTHALHRSSGSRGAATTRMDQSDSSRQT